MDERRINEANATAVAQSIDEPFFLVGSERSGTTLLRLMLSHHPEIECAPEFEFLVERMTPEEAFPPLEDYRDWLATNRIFLPHGLTVDPSLDYRKLVRSFLAQFCERSGRPIWGATCHKHFDRLERLWPRARYVHLLRDGRDVARSCIGMGWVGNVWHGAERWLEAEHLWDRIVARTPPERCYELRYEDLIVEPERELQNLCTFLGTAYTPAMMDYEKTSTYGRPDPKLVEQWRRKLSPRELALLERRMGARLRERGYPESGVSPARVGPLGRLGLWLDDRLARARNRRKRYGLTHVLLARFARTFGLRGIERRLLLKQNTIDNEYIK